jgi:hypothetical protein
MSNTVDGDPSIQYDLTYLINTEIFLIGLGVVALLISKFKREKHKVKSVIVLLAFSILLVFKLFI